MGNNISSSTEYDDTVTELPLSNSNPKKSLLPTESAKIVLTAEMDTPFNTAPNEASVDSSLYNSCEIGAFPKHNVVSSHNEIYFRSEKSLLSSSISIDKIDHAAKLFSKAFTHRRPTAPADIELGEFSVKEARRSLGGIPMQNFTNEVASTVPRNFQQQSQHSSKSIAPPPTDDMISSSLFLNSNADFLRLKSKSSLQDSFSLAFSAHTSANNLFNYSKQVEEDIEMGSGSIITDYYKINQRRSLGEESKQEKVESTFRQQISEPIMKVAPEDILKPKQAFGVKRSTNQYYDPYLPRASRDIESQNFEASITEGERLAKPLRVVTLRNSEVRRNSADSHEIKSASISSLGSTRFNNMHSLVFSDFQDSDSGSLATVTSQNMLSMNTLLDPKSNFEDFIIPQLSIPGTYQKQERVNVFKNFNKRQDASITDLLKFSENTFLKKQRSNSCSTLFIDFTMIQADLKVTLTCAASFLKEIIKKNVNTDKLHSNDIFSEILHPLSKEISFCKKIPSQNDIFKFLDCIFASMELNVECAIIALIYIKRMLSSTGITLQISNWARVVLSGLILAAKVWDDHAVWTVDFCQIFPDIEVADLNKLEQFFLAAINFNVSVKLSNYAKTYFELRKFDHSAEKVQLGENQVKIVNAPLMKRPTVPDADVINDVELELRMLESGKQDRQLSFSTRDLQDALERSINSTQSSSLHGKHVNLKEATMQLQNERLMRRSRSDYIFVGAFKPANV